MNWRLVESNTARYFELTDGDYSAIYTTKQGQDGVAGDLQPVFLKQIHSDIIIDVDTDPARTGDGLTTSAGRCIGVRVADCLPVYLFADERVCIIHCGWRGIKRGIAKKAKKLMADFRYALGACIGPCCYEVQQDVRDLFIDEYPDSIQTIDGAYHLDLRSAVMRDLGAGAMIASLDMCTKCHPEHFYSHRLGDAQRNYALIARRE